MWFNKTIVVYGSGLFHFMRVRQPKNERFHIFINDDYHNQELIIYQIPGTCYTVQRRRSFNDTEFDRHCELTHM